MRQSRSARCCIQALIQPVGDRLDRQREIADLAVSLCTLGPREHSGRHRPCIRQAGGLIVDLVRRYVVIFGTRQEKHVLTNKRRDLLCPIAGSCSKHRRRRVSESLGMSQRCQQETHAAQKMELLFDHLVGAGVPPRPRIPYWKMLWGGGEDIAFHRR
jgi:hypothetical protein